MVSEHSCSAKRARLFAIGTGSSNPACSSNEIVYSGGGAIGTTINSGGALTVSSGGIAFNGTIEGGGLETVLSGGSTEFDLINGSLILAGGDASLENINPGGSLTALSGGSAGATVVLGGGLVTVSSGGASVATELMRGIEVVAPGGTASGTFILNSGLQVIDSGGIASGTIISSGDSEIVSSGGIDIGATVYNGGSQTILAGGTSSATVLDGSATQYAYGIASGTSVGSGDTQFIEAGGLAVGAIIQSGGEEIISAGGTASGTAVNSGSDEIVLSGGVATGTPLRSGGTIDVAYLPNVSGGSATLDQATDVLTVSEGGQTYTQQLSGNYAGYSFNLAPDGNGGTDVMLVRQQSGTPVITAPTTATLGVGQPAAISGVSISESPITSGDAFTAVLTDTNGLLSANTSASGGGGTITSSGTTSLTIAGTLAQVNADLTTLTDTDATTPSDTITVNASDSFGNTAAPQKIAVTVTSTAPVLGAGGNTIFWTEGNPPTVIDNTLTVADTGGTTLTGATVTIASGFLTGDQLNFTNQNGIAGNYAATTEVLTLSGTASVADYQAALDSVSYSSTSPSPSAAGADSVRTIAWQSVNGAALSDTVTSTVDVGQIYTPIHGANTIHAGAGNDIVVATSPLNAGDVIDGGGGMNTLVLAGAGTFNLALPETLTDIELITAQEGQAAYTPTGGASIPSTRQTVYLRDGLNATVNVASDTAVNPQDPKIPGITIYGANRVPRGPLD